MGILLSGCGAAEESAQLAPSATALPPPTQEPSQTPLAMASSTAVPTAANTLTPTSTASPTATILPTETPMPLSLISVPPQWLEKVKQVIEAYNQNTAEMMWQVTSSIQAPVRLVNEDGSFIVKQEPVVLAVPFTAEWHDIGLEEAQTILNEGHDYVELMLWSDMPLGKKALRVNGRSARDPDYPFQDTYSLQVDAGHEKSAKSLLPFLQEAGTEPTIHITAVGDIMLDRSLGTAIENGYLAYPFAETAAELAKGDITIGNIESALGDRGEPEAKRYPFRAPPQAAESLALAGFDIVSLANNHAGDYGFEALQQAVDLLEAQGIASIGAGQNAQEAHAPHIRDVNGLNTAFFSYVHVPVEASTGFDTASWTATEEEPGLAWAEPELIQSDIAAIRDEVDLVVVTLHSGFEYQAPPSEPQIEAAHAAVDAGADLVIGHHAHILQGIEFYGDGAIIYGTGNFAFEIDGAPETAVFHIWLDEDGVRQIEIAPAVIQFGGQPRMAESWEDPAILNRVYHLTNILNAK